MADTKITALTALTGADPANDVIPIVDVSDTTMAASGTTKKISVNNILGASGTATLASATITGALTVGNGTSATQTFSGVTNILDIGYGSLRGGSAYGDVRLWTDRFRIYNNAGTQIVKNISGTNGDETWYDGAGGTRMTLNSTGLGVGIVPSSFGRFSVQGTAVSAGILGMNTDATRCDIQSYNVPLAINRAGNNITMCEGGGNVGIGVTPIERLTVAGTASVGGTGNIGVKFHSGNPVTGNLAWLLSNDSANSNILNLYYYNAGVFSGRAFVVNQSGNFIVRTPATPPTIPDNEMMVFNLTSNTNLRISVKGTDGTVRTANITLA